MLVFVSRQTLGFIDSSWSGSTTVHAVASELQLTLLVLALCQSTCQKNFRICWSGNCIKGQSQTPSTSCTLVAHTRKREKAETTSYSSLKYLKTWQAFLFSNFFFFSVYSLWLSQGQPKNILAQKFDDINSTTHHALPQPAELVPCLGAPPFHSHTMTLIACSAFLVLHKLQLCLTRLSGRTRLDYGKDPKKRFFLN